MREAPYGWRYIGNGLVCNFSMFSKHRHKTSGHIYEFEDIASRTDIGIFIGPKGGRRVMLLELFDEDEVSEDSTDES